MKLIIASNNQNKIREIKEILGDIFEDIVSLKDAGIVHETVEDGDTFFANAYKKAKEITDISGAFALSDDSGLCVDALGGAPGIYSARYSGEHGNDEDNINLLLRNLKREKNRSAHFVSSVVITAPNGSYLSAEGYVYGEIIEEKRGCGGFGYDPVFYIPEIGKTAAEISSDEKNKISHRGNALRLLLEKIKENPEFTK